MHPSLLREKLLDEAVSLLHDGNARLGEDRLIIRQVVGVRTLRVIEQEGHGAFGMRALGDGGEVVGHDHQAKRLMAGAQPLDHLPDNVPIDLLNRPDFRLDIAVMPRLIWRLNMIPIAKPKFTKNSS
jgi:hypothetical protein